MPRDVCPTCNHELDVPEKYVAKMWRCPDCSTRFVPCVPRPPAPSRAWLSDALFWVVIALLASALAFVLSR